MGEKHDEARRRLRSLSSLSSKDLALGLSLVDEIHKRDDELELLAPKVAGLEEAMAKRNTRIHNLRVNIKQLQRAYDAYRNAYSVLHNDYTELRRRAGVRPFEKFPRESEEAK